MDEAAKRSVERFLAWCGPIFVVGIIITWAVMGHNVPPPNMMGMTAEQLVSEYYGKYPDIAPGMIGAATFGLFYTLWSCLLASLMRDENGQVGALSFIELAGGILTGWLFAFCSAIWATCSLLVNQVQPETIKMVHTFTWVIFDCTYMITTIQMVALGLYTILNKRQTMFPAWAGWATAAIGIGFVGVVLMPFVTEGPFAINGLWNFWIVFSTWLFVFFASYNFFVLKYVYSSPENQARASGRLAKA
ncbi:MAG: hypothetical protein IPP45_16480 [Sphingomonadales bacterium]|nr:hypothetical protein [Sphingomonadales bacterium]